MNLFDSINIISFILFYSILTPFIDNLIDYNTSGWLLFLLLNLISWKILWLNNLHIFKFELLSGEPNTYLTKPANTYLLASTSKIPGSNFISLLYIFPIIFYIIYMNKYSNIILATIFTIFSWFYFMSFFNCLKSTAFFMKNNDFLTTLAFNINSTVKRFTPMMFKKLIFLYLRIENRVNRTEPNFRYIYK